MAPRINFKRLSVLKFLGRYKALFYIFGGNIIKHIDIAEILKDSSFVGKEVTVCGWVRTSRDSKNMAFIELNDGTSLKHLQIVIDKSVL